MALRINASSKEVFFITQLKFDFQDPEVETFPALGERAEKRAEPLEVLARRDDVAGPDRLAAFEELVDLVLGEIMVVVVAAGEDDLYVEVLDRFLERARIGQPRKRRDF